MDPARRSRQAAEDRPWPDGLLNNLPGMVYRCHHHRQRRLLFASEGCLALTGYPATELTDDQGIAYGDLIHPDDREAVWQEIETAIQEGRSYHCIYRLISTAKQQRWVWESGRGVYVEDGDLWVLEGFIADANEQMSAFLHMQHRFEDQSRKLAALHEILEALSTPDELPIILEKSLKAALVAAQGDAGFIHLRQKSGDNMRLIAQQRIPDPVADSISRVSTEDGLVAWVAQKRKPLLIPNISEDPRTVYLATRGDLKVYVGVPISRGARVWGTLSVLGKDPAQFGDEEVALLISVGEEIGMVVENARLRRQAEQLLLVQERNRLARELHDSVTQSLYSATLFAEAGRRTAATDENEEIAGYFSQIGETGQQALKEMRLLIHELRPSILAKEGLVRALQHRLNSVEARAGVKNQLIVEGEAMFSPSLEDALYQIAQEALNNALKHATATEILVRLDTLNSKLVILRVEDNGRGFDLETAKDSDGMGLTSMRERAELFDGVLTIESTVGQGTIVEASLRASEATSGQRADFHLEDLI